MTVHISLSGIVSILLIRLSSDVDNNRLHIAAGAAGGRGAFRTSGATPILPSPILHLTLVLAAFGAWVLVIHIIVCCLRFTRSRMFASPTVESVGKSSGIMTQPPYALLLNPNNSGFLFLSCNARTTLGHSLL
jgi:hypothetical protein